MRRMVPWAVLGAAIAVGAWVLTPILPLAAHGPVALLGVAAITVRIVSFLGAVAGGSFALSLRPSGGSRPLEARTRRRLQGLRALGAASVVFGIVGLASPLIGFSIGHAGGFIAAAGVLGGLAAWSTRQLSRDLKTGATNTATNTAATRATRREIEAGRLGDEWSFSMKADRVRTPAP